VLWVATDRTEAHVGIYVPRLGRYTFYSQFGEVRMFGVPRSPLAAKARPIVRRIRNGDVAWDACYLVRIREPSLDRQDLLQTIMAEPEPGTAADELLQLAPRATSRGKLTQPLLEALEDPDQFAAAHALLSYHVERGGWASSMPEEVGRSVRWNFSGLAIELDRGAAEKLEWIPDGYRLRHRGGAVRIDPASRVAVRDLWHTLLDVPMGSAPYWPFALATAVLPVTRLGLKLKRRRDARRGLCLCCGYDLCATPGRCPECGTTPATVGTA